MFTTNSWKYYVEKCGDNAQDIKCIMHTSILKDLLQKFKIEYIVRVELVAFSMSDADVYVRVILQDFSYIAKYSFLAFLNRKLLTPDLQIVPTIISNEFKFKNMSFIATSEMDTLIVDHDYIKQYATVYENTPFKIFYDVFKI